MNIKTISLETYNDLRAKIRAYDNYVRKNFTNASGVACYRPDQIPFPEVSNEDRSKVEVYEFMNQRPDKYLLCVKLDGPKSTSFTATTWAGDTLGRGNLIKKLSRKVNAFSRVTSWKVRIQGINGRTYEGTYYSHDGDYAKVQAIK